MTCYICDHVIRESEQYKICEICNENGLCHSCVLDVEGEFDEADPFFCGNCDSLRGSDDSFSSSDDEFSNVVVLDFIRNMRNNA